MELLQDIYSSDITEDKYNKRNKNKLFNLKNKNGLFNLIGISIDKSGYELCKNITNDVNESIIEYYKNNKDIPNIDNSIYIKLAIFDKFYAEKYNSYKTFVYHPDYMKILNIQMKLLKNNNNNDLYKEFINFYDIADPSIDNDYYNIINKNNNEKNKIQNKYLKYKLKYLNLKKLKQI
jgi:hypothetical protein